MKIFLDTNILIDLVADRTPFSNWAYKIFEEQKKGRWELITTANSILTTFYIVEKQIGKKKSLRIISILLKRLTINSISKSHLYSAMVGPFADYEDAVLHQCATEIQSLDYIITRNKKDFRKSEIPILSSEELFINI
jgi:predicted nucleic acid-binding protein